MEIVLEFSRTGRESFSHEDFNFEVGLIWSLQCWSNFNPKFLNSVSSLPVCYLLWDSVFVI